MCVCIILMLQIGIELLSCFDFWKIIITDLVYTLKVIYNVQNYFLSRMHYYVKFCPINHCFSHLLFVLLISNSTTHHKSTEILKPWSIDLKSSDILTSTDLFSFLHNFQCKANCIKIWSIVWKINMHGQMYRNLHHIS